MQFILCLYNIVFIVPKSKRISEKVSGEYNLRRGGVKKSSYNSRQNIESENLLCLQYIVSGKYDKKTRLNFCEQQIFAILNILI